MAPGLFTEAGKPVARRDPGECSVCDLGPPPVSLQ